MTVLVDTGVLYTDHDTDATSDSLDLVYDGKFGQPYISDYIYDETVTVTLKRGSFEAAKQLGERLGGVDPYPETYNLLRVSEGSVFSLVPVMGTGPPISSSGFDL